MLRRFKKIRAVHTFLTASTSDRLNQSGTQERENAAVKTKKKKEKNHPPLYKKKVCGLLSYLKLPIADMSKEPLEVLLEPLKLDNLKNLYKMFKLTAGKDTKEQRIERLCKFARTQSTLFSLTNPVRKQ